MHDHQLIYSWRTINLRARDYIFNSTLHKTYIRLNYIFLSQTALPFFLLASISSFTISDHALTHCVLELLNHENGIVS